MNIGSLVPQVFHDLIARVAPGMVVLISSIFVWRGDKIAQDLHNAFEWSSNKDSPVLFIFLISLLVSYTIAIVLDGWWSILLSDYPHKSAYKQFLKCGKRALSNFKKICPQFQKDDVEKQFPSFPLMYDYIRIRTPEAGARLAKLRAESHMCVVLLVGWIVLAVLNILNFLIGSWLFALVLEIVLLFAIVAIIKARKHFEQFFFGGLWNHWLLTFECDCEKIEEPNKMNVRASSNSLNT